MSLGVMGSSAGAGEDIIKTGTYIGDGKYGTNNARSLTFSKKPNFVMIFGDYGALAYFAPSILASSFSTTFVLTFPSGSGSMNNYVSAKYDTSTNTLYWCATSNSSNYLKAACNENTRNYTWVAYF